MSSKKTPTRSTQPTVSVIVPVFNCEEYLGRCLDSIFTQTVNDFELIAIDDGSTDSSLSILEKYAKRHKNMRLIVQSNHGQGYARNRALDEAKGEYVLFVDSDDFIEPLTIELALTRALQDKSDVVHFDWKLSSDDEERPKTFVYYNYEPFSHKNCLVGDECDEFVRMNNFFSVNNLYKKSFLDKHKLRYGEGHIYEDNAFMVQVANKARKISLIHSPLYIVQRNLTSTTRSNIDTDKHYKDFIRAVRLAFGSLEPRLPHTSFYLASYFLEKFLVYYERRIPARYRSLYIRDFVDILHAQELVPPPGTQHYRFLRLCIEQRVFEEQRYGAFRALIVYKLKLMPHGKRAILRAKQLKHRLVYPPGNYPGELRKPVMQDSIVFLGFDYRYIGNSKYLFDEMIADPRFKQKKIRFVTNDESLDAQYRLQPDSEEANKWIARAEIMIAESWVPGKIKKRHQDSVWIQLWHGTPLKKVLFDSHEPEIVSVRTSHKIHKYQDVMRWDYLVADSRAAADKFASAFLFPRERMLITGYPRVKYLLENKGNQKLMREIKQKIGLSKELTKKKIILYAPTWRDYNYQKSRNEGDFSYLLDVNALADKLGDEYLVLFHDHNYLESDVKSFGPRCINATPYDIQELLLISDGLVSDYSSIIFDAFPLAVPVVIYATDENRYQESRGIYGDIWKDLDALKADSATAVANMLTNSLPNEAYESFTRSYCYQPNDNILEFISGLNIKNMKKDW